MDRIKLLHTLLFIAEREQVQLQPLISVFPKPATDRLRESSFPIGNCCST